jgi:hypothetical protein
LIGDNISRTGVHRHNEEAADVAASDWLTDSAPVERLPGTGKTKVIIVLIDSHGLFIDGLGPVKCRALG